ncbi:hypothetical protein Glove_587g3 [Diversispora epigaea]|uniref:Uncharacterized protein n=1 Tax=Diversispora epigaea TaxID=1348612 RepID=A0A397GE04_9GLOM|nr:hypothetical protein Glove_587g3 [Diversispora epigaea]
MYVFQFDKWTIENGPIQKWDIENKQWEEKRNIQGLETTMMILNYAQDGI